MKHKMKILCVLILSVGCTKKAAITTDSKTADPVKTLQEKIAKAPSYENYIALGMEYAKQKMSAEAMAAYRKASEINPNAPVAWNNICAEFNSQGKYASAIPNCEKALELEPKFELAKNNLNYAKAQFENVVKNLEEKKKQLLVGKPTSQDFINLGMEFYNAEEYKSSVDLWKRVKASDPLYATALNNLASSYIILKDFALAEKALQEALKREPNNQLFANNKKWLEQEKSLKK